MHLVVKAVSEQGQRLNIRKAALREWRQQFARQLRVQGIAANATTRAERGVTRGALLDGIFRAARAGHSEFLRGRFLSVDAELRAGGLKPESGKQRLFATRAGVQQAWRDVGDALQRQGHSGMAAEVARFVERMPRVRTDREWAASAIVAHVHQKTRDREAPTR